MYNVWVSFAIFLSWFLPTPRHHSTTLMTTLDQLQGTWADLGIRIHGGSALVRRPDFSIARKALMKKNISPRGFVFFGLVGIYLWLLLGELKAWLFLGILCLLYWWFIHGCWDGIAIPAAVIKQYQLAQYYSIYKSMNLGCFTLHKY